MQQTQEKAAYFYTPMIHIAKNRVDISGVCIDGQTQYYQVRDTATGEEYYAAFIEHAGDCFIQPLEWLFDVGNFKPVGELVHVTPGVEILGTVTGIYEFRRVPNAFEYEKEAAKCSK